MRDIDQISGDVLDVALKLHRELGPGLLESVYEMVLAGKLAAMGYTVERQRPVDIEFEGMAFVAAFRIDLLVDRRLILEIKSIDRLNGAHAKQLLTYLGSFSIGCVRPASVRFERDAFMVIRHPGLDPGSRFLRRPEKRDPGSSPG